MFTDCNFIIYRSHIYFCIQYIIDKFLMAFDFDKLSKINAWSCYSH